VEEVVGKRGPGRSTALAGRDELTQVASLLVNELFAPPDESWQRVARELVVVRRIVLFISVVLVTTSLAVGLWFWLQVPGLVVALSIGAVAVAWGLWLIPRNWRAWGYAERDDDLLVTHGVLIRRLTVVPYGRMQYVDVASGPLERRYKLATVQMHTASPATDAMIPGLPAPEAARLRDRLSALGEARAAGL
jgi:membrane protein YdbS with pleckstrin-like domain